MKTNKEIVTEIIEDLENTVGINWPSWGKLNKNSLIKCWSTYRDIKDYEFYGYSTNTTLSKQYIKLFSNINKRNSRSWKCYILFL